MRFVTLNLWGGHEPLAARLAAAAAGLRRLAPDIVLLQEVRVADDVPNTAEQLAAALGLRATYACATRGDVGLFGPGSTAGEEGLAILTRHAVAETRTLVLPDARPDETRILLSALVDSGEGRVWAHTTHLHYRARDGVARERQVVAIDEAISALGDDAIHVLGGDLNAAPDCDEIRFLNGRTTLDGRRAYWQDAFRAVHPDASGHTWSRLNPNTGLLPFLERDRRIDYLFVSPERRDGRGRIMDARVVLDAPEDGTWPSDHLGVLGDVQL